jgi:flagellar protein FlbD
MIRVKKMDGDEIVINAELIETIQATPDIVITLTNNKKFLVMDSEDEIINKVIEYRRRVLYPSEGIEKG